MTATAAVRTGRILFVRLDSVGDVLLTGPAVRAVASSAAHVTMLVRESCRGIAQLLPGVDEVLTFDAPWVLLEAPQVHPHAVAELLSVLEGGRFDGAIISTSFHQSPLPMALLLRLARIGWVGAISDDYPGSLLDLRHHVPVERLGELSEAERALSLVSAAGFSPDADGSRLAVRRPLPDVSAIVGEESYVVFHPGAAVPARRPTAEHSRRLAAALVDAGHRVAITGAGSESTLTAYVAGELALDLGGRLDLPQLAAVLDGAAVVVAPNTGPAHLAAAVQTPVVSLFAPVVPAERWAPHGVRTVVLGDQDAACRGSRARECPVPGHPCLDGITPASVVAAVQELSAVPAASSVSTGQKAAQRGGTR